MLIGAMNDPTLPVEQEIVSHAELGVEFIDLTLEPPLASSWTIDAEAIAALLREHRLPVVGHTAFYLPLASPFEEVRRGAVTEMLRCIDKFAVIGARWVNVHPDRNIPMHTRAFWVEQNLRSLGEILEYAHTRDIGLMIENLPSSFNTADELADLLDPLPDLGLHLDIGHANLHVYPNATEEILERFGGRLRHVHLHDNKGGTADLHLPLGTGTVRVPEHIASLKRAGYDGTITLEVFSPDHHYLAYSMDVLRRIWNSAD